MRNNTICYRPGSSPKIYSESISGTVTVNHNAGETVTLKSRTGRGKHGIDLSVNLCVVLYVVPSLLCFSLTKHDNTVIRDTVGMIINTIQSYKTIIVPV